MGRQEDDARTKALRWLKELEETQNKMNLEIQKYRDSDPEVLAQMKENIGVRQNKKGFLPQHELIINYN